MGVFLTFMVYAIYMGVSANVKDAIKREAFTSNRYKRCKNCKYEKMTLDMAFSHCNRHNNEVIRDITWCESFQDRYDEEE